MPPRKAHNCIGCGTVEPTDFAKTMKSKCKKCQRLIPKQVKLVETPPMAAVKTDGSLPLTAANLSHYQYYQLHGTFPPPTTQLPTTIEQGSVHDTSESGSHREEVRHEYGRVAYDFKSAISMIDSLFNERNALRNVVYDLTNERNFYRDQCAHFRQVVFGSEAVVFDEYAVASS